MAVKMRLRREGKKKQPFYRVVVADVRSPRDGRFIEDIGYYQPLHEPSTISIDRERALYWLRTGVQPSDAVTKLLRIEGIWEEFKPGDPGRDRSAKHEQRAERAREAAAKAAAAEEAAAEERRARQAQAEAEAVAAQGGEAPEAGGAEAGGAEAGGPEAGGAEAGGAEAGGAEAGAAESPATEAASEESGR